MLAAAQDGDEEAFTQLWLDGNAALLRYLRVIAPEAAEDIAADTWVQVIRGLPRFRGDEAAWRAWLFTTARRRGCRRHRARAPEHTDSDRAAGGPATAAGRGDLAAGGGRPGHRSGGKACRAQPRRGQGSRSPGAAAAGPDTDRGWRNAMTDRGVSDSDMLNFSRRARRDAPGIQDASLAALLAGAVPPPDAPAPLQHVADVLAALQAAP